MQKNSYLFTYIYSFLTGAQDSHPQRVTIPQAACIQLQRRPPEDERGNTRNVEDFNTCIICK
jgi:hypothetical protein